MAKAKQMSGGEAIVKALEANGVDTAFGIPGVHTLALYDALVDSKITHIFGRHEQGVGFMADGYARASGKPGVALVITGPGVTNIATAVGEAYTESTPLLVVASSEDRRWLRQMDGNFHDLTDQIGIMRPLVKYAVEITDASQIPLRVNDAFRTMAAGRARPSYIEIPRDLMEAEAPIAIPNPVAVERPGPTPESIRAAVEVLKNANKIVIYAGGGAVSSGATAALTALADRLGAAVLTSQMGKGSVAEDNPRVLGNLWDAGNPVNGLLREADAAIVIGSKLGVFETNNGEMPLPETLIRIDIDPVEADRHYPATLAIVADAARTAEALVDALASEGVSKPGFAAERIAEVKSAVLDNLWGGYNAPYLDALRRAIPRDGILSVDTTMMAYMAARRYPVYEPRTWLIPSGYLTLGFAMPAALGAKVACPDKAVVALVGDGGFQFTMHELATAMQFKLGVPIVIFNDSTYTAVKQDQAMRYDRRHIAVDLVNPDFGKLADAYGMPWSRANSPEELEAAVTEALTRDLPTIIDVPIAWEY